LLEETVGFMWFGVPNTGVVLLPRREGLPKTGVVLPLALVEVALTVVVPKTGLALWIVPKVAPPWVLAVVVPKTGVELFMPRKVVLPDAALDPNVLAPPPNTGVAVFAALAPNVLLSPPNIGVPAFPALDPNVPPPNKVAPVVPVLGPNTLLPPLNAGVPVFPKVLPPLALDPNAPELLPNTGAALAAIPKGADAGLLLCASLPLPRDGISFPEESISPHADITISSMGLSDLFVSTLPSSSRASIPSSTSPNTTCFPLR
jgi:hypothetical protein